jgi:hypothetical protein
MAFLRGFDCCFPALDIFPARNQISSADLWAGAKEPKVRIPLELGDLQTTSLRARHPDDRPLLVYRDSLGNYGDPAAAPIPDSVESVAPNRGPGISIYLID